MDTSIVTVKGQIVIPAKIRKKIGLIKGSKVAITEKENGFMVEPLNEKYFAKFAGLLKGNGKATKALLEERRKDREREDHRSR
jgi:AbrB family looped-hinge helix DNA binding protein